MGSASSIWRPDDFTSAIQDEQGLLWVDMQAEPPEACEPILHETFGFHPLAVDDALRESHVPKVDDWGEYLYLVLHAVVLNQRDGDPVDTLELDVFFGQNYVVTYHEQAIDAVDRVWDACQRDKRYLANGRRSSAVSAWSTSWWPGTCRWPTRWTTRSTGSRIGS